MSNTASSQDSIDVQFLKPALWQRLNTSDTAEALAETWLELQIQQITGADAGLVLLRRADGMTPAALVSDNPTQAKALTLAAEEAAERGSGLIKGRADRYLAYPITLDGESLGAVSIHVGPATDDQMRLRLRHLQWGLGWLRDRLRADDLAQRNARLEQAQTALTLQATALSGDGFASACRSVATDLARRLGAERVSIGVRRLGRTRIAAISHSAGFGRKTSLVRTLSAAMDEAIDQNSGVLIPAPADGPVLATRAHEQLAKASGAAYILTVPLVAEDHLFGAVTVERDADHPLTHAELQMLDGALALLGPVLRIKRGEDRWILTKFFSVVGAHMRRLTGPNHLKRKIAVVAIVALVGLFWWAKAPYTVSADARLEGSIQRAVVAQLDGYIREAPYSAGDLVKEGDLMVAFDDRELALERLRWVTERQRQILEYERALAERDRAATQVAQTQIAQSDAQILLVDETIARSQLYVPFSGIVVSGDLSQRIGSSATRGEVLFEVAPEGGHRVVLQVAERRIAEVSVGQTGSLVLTALPENVFPIEVTKITPIASASEGRNNFRVEARLNEEAAALRPGMEGLAKLALDERRLIWIWTQPVWEWGRLTLWSLWPGI